MGNAQDFCERSDNLLGDFLSLLESVFAAVLVSG
jgi:hypothetical protein